MHIENLSLLSYKNYEQLEISFHQNLNCFVGNNGVGKTNLLDAIYYLCMCKSYLNSTELYNIRTGDDFMMLQGLFHRENKPEELICSFKPGKKKQVRRNKKEYGKLSDHIGLFPIVMVSPNDSVLIIEGSDERRRYINGVVSQYDKVYLENIIAYNKILAQRNKLLKESAFASLNIDLLEVYNQQIVPLSELIHNARISFIEKLKPVFQYYYEYISGGREQIDLVYKSQLTNQDYHQLLRDTIQKDRILKHTSVGIHRDDLELKLQDMPIKRFGSQGQQKTFLVALKLAQYEFLKKLKNVSPILLLDDIFDKFDSNRVEKILQLVSGDPFGQIFITHTNEERMRMLLDTYPNNYHLFRIEEQQVNKI